MSTIEKPYGQAKRPAHTIARSTKGHPRRQARRDRAATRAIGFTVGDNFDKMQAAK